jgi:Domain of unknown function (DUF4157)
LTTYTHQPPIITTTTTATHSAWRGLPLQRKCACGSSASELSGECEECSKKKMLGMQSKLAISEPGDQYEQEADRVATQVMAMRPSSAVSGTPLRIQRFSGQSAPLNSVDPAPATPGRPLESALREHMEQRFGHDFSRVHVHTDSEADRSTRDLSAHAYTLGHDIVFGQGRFAPETSEGRHLLAHELTHVVQQSRSSHPAVKATVPHSVLLRQEDPTAPPVGPETPIPSPQPAPDETRPVPAEEKPGSAARTDAFGKECPDSVVLHETKAIPAYNRKMFDAGFKTYFGLVSNMKVGPKSSYESCITEVLKVEENTCGDQGNMADYEPCTPKKHCMKVGEACGGDVLTDTKFPCSSTTFVDLHRTARDVSLLEGSGKTECKAKCLQRYGCGGKEIGRFYVTRNFKAAEFTDGSNKVHVTTGSIEKVAATK